MNLYDANEYRATKNWPYAVCAGCLIYRVHGNEPEVLLLSRDADNEITAEDFLTYHLPKGHLRFDETLVEAAVREVREETGSLVEVETYLGALTKEYTYKDNRYNRTFHFFAAKWIESVQDMDSEHDGSKWTKLREAEELLALPNPKGEDEIVRRFKRYLELTNAA